MLGVDLVVLTVTPLQICVRDASKARDFTLPSGCTLVTNYDDILEDPEIDTVIEVMGGVTHAKDVVFAAIAKGKHVITANKAMIANFMDELLALLAANPTVKFGFEAAVCGGIPIIHSLQQCYLADDIVQLCGIFNGTTNFMLSKMEAEGADYDVVLKEAQDLGFAEAVPTADVGGFDAQAKLAIMIKLAYGMTVDPAAIPTTGITEVSSDDFAYCAKLNSTVKLCGWARMAEDGKVSCFVSPVVVPKSNTVATTSGATNIVQCISKNNQVSCMVGPGAGRYPTANSVVTDIMALATGFCPPPFRKEVRGGRGC